MGSSVPYLRPRGNRHHRYRSCRVAWKRDCSQSVSLFLPSRPPSSFRILLVLWSIQHLLNLMNSHLSPSTTLQPLPQTPSLRWSPPHLPRRPPRPRLLPTRRQRQLFERNPNVRDHHHRSRVRRLCLLHRPRHPDRASVESRLRRLPSLENSLRSWSSLRIHRNHRR